MAHSKVDYWLTKDGLTLLEGWARDGLTDEQIMHNMKIKSKSTYYSYMKKYSNISNAIKKGKEVVDYEVENALLKRAKGYEYTEETYEDGILKKKVTKQVAPDSTAIIFWLKNRQPKKWRDKVELTNDDEKMKEINKNISNIANMLNHPQKNRVDDDVQ